jgi:AraC family transcriptional regulator, transcriptional activator of pobA
MPRRQHIPQHSITNHSPHGLLVRYMKDERFSPSHEVHVPHRDDHYAFIYQQTGNNQLVVDFNTVRLRGQRIFCLLPGQVHQVTHFDKVDAWFMAVTAEFIPERVRAMFEQTLHPIQPAKVSGEWPARLKAGLSLLQSYLDDALYPEDPFQLVKATTHSVLSAFAAIYHEQEQHEILRENRTTELTRKFKLLLQQHYKTIKSPADYAAMLNVSPAYLNECVKSTTGTPVSQWIHREIVLEAKRVLYYTDITVKELAFTLGYEDHTYFTRLFGKAAGISPLVFRTRSRQ